MTNMYWTKRAISIANAESRVTAWANYLARAEEAKDAKRVDYGLLRLGNAQRRLRKIRRP